MATEYKTSNLDRLKKEYPEYREPNYELITLGHMCTIKVLRM